jgi:hypothetical protein
VCPLLHAYHLLSAFNFEYTLGKGLIVDERAIRGIENDNRLRLLSEGDESVRNICTNTIDVFL